MPQRLFRFSFSGVFLRPVFLIIVLASPLFAGSARAEKEKVPIGVIAPLSGPQASYGEDLRRVTEKLLPLLSARSDRYEFELRLEDGKCGMGSDAVTAAQKLINVDHVHFLIVACSGELMPVAPLAEKSKVVVIGTAATHPDISKLGEYVFRTSPNISDGVTILVSRLKRMGKKKVAILTEESAFTNGILGVMKVQLGDSLGLTQSFPPNSGDLRPLVTKALGSGADALYLNFAAPATYQSVVRLLRAQQSTIPSFAYHQPSEPQNIQSLGADNEGIVYFDVAVSEHPPALYGEVLDAIRVQFPQGTTTEWLARTAFDATMAIKRVVDTVGPDAEKGKDYLLTIDEPGALNRLHFNKDGDVDSPPFGLFVVDHGVAKTVPSE